MKNFFLLVAVGCLALVAVPAQAQYYVPASPVAPVYGYPANYGYGPSYGVVTPGYGVVNPGTYVPGGYVHHRRHLDYVPPRVDYRFGGRPYGMVPTPYYHHHH